jgi:hypothetical protein
MQGALSFRQRSCISCKLCDCDTLVEIHILDGIQDPDTFIHRALESFAAGDQALSAGALVDDGGCGSFDEVALT